MKSQEFIIFLPFNNLHCSPKESNVLGVFHERMYLLQYCIWIVQSGTKSSYPTTSQLNKVWHGQTKSGRGVRHAKCHRSLCWQGVGDTGKRWEHRSKGAEGAQSIVFVRKWVKQSHWMIDVFQSATHLESRKWRVVALARAHLYRWVSKPMNHLFRWSFSDGVSFAINGLNFHGVRINSEPP